MWLTHGNPINLGVVGFVIITVECFLSESKGGTDGLGVPEVLRNCYQTFVDVVHGWNDGANAGCTTREEECAMLENLMLR
jgi:hypothetical protein